MIATTKKGEQITLLPIGTRIRSIQHPELTGYIKGHEYADSEHISPIPYLIGWDDPHLAHDIIGWFFVYADNETVEPQP
jgi:hypothetical protein